MLDERIGNTPRWYLSPPKDAGMRFPDAITKCVVFLGIKSNNEFKAGGTGFFVEAPSERTTGNSHIYLVTAQHCVDGIAARETFVRANAPDGSIVEISLGTSPDWIMHPTDGVSGALWVDVAVLPWVLSDGIVSFTPMPITGFIKDEHFLPGFVGAQAYPIGFGDEVFIVGLFTKHHGRRTNLPIVRTGTIAMIPSEPVALKDKLRNMDREMEAYLIESRSIGGLSGSPVFVRETMIQQGSEGKLYLLGLIHGHWDVPEGALQSASELGEDVADTAQNSVNMGIAMVVPAKKIAQTLNRPDLIEQREQVDRQRERKNAPTPD